MLIECHLIMKSRQQGHVSTYTQYPYNIAWILPATACIQYKALLNTAKLHTYILHNFQYNTKRQEPLEPVDATRIGSQRSSLSIKCLPNSVSI